MYAILSLAILTAAPMARPGVPNILIVVCEDWGIDQLPGEQWGSDAMAIPVLDAMGNRGVQFTRAWSMADMSASQASLLTGRMPIRTRVAAHAVPGSVTATQLHPWEITLPDMLATAGYHTGMFGQYAVGCNDPTGLLAPSTTGGFEEFSGIIDRLGDVDSTLGGQVPEGTFDCGLPMEDAGACCFADGTCDDGLESIDCIAAGGTPLVEASSDGGWIVATDCGDGCSSIDHNLSNGHYRWTQLTIQAGATDPGSMMRDQWAALDLADQAAQWVHGHLHSPPWFCMATLPAPGGPLQPAPQELLTTVLTNLHCDVDVHPADAREARRGQLEAFDSVLGAMFDRMQIGEYNNGVFEFDESTINWTWIILVGGSTPDNRLLDAPLDGGFVGSLYQSRLWVPMMVVGPQMDQPGRSSDAMVNITDVFALVADLAEVDLGNWFDDHRSLDAVSLRPIMTDATITTVRDYNYADRGVVAYPVGWGGLCIVDGQCEDHRHLDSHSCQAVGGVFYPTGDPWADCCDYYGHAPGQEVPSMREWTIRNDQYKLILRQGDACPRDTSCSIEFHHLTVPLPPMLPGLESEATRIELPPADADDAAALGQLQAELLGHIESQPYCVGDTNRDARVNTDDLIAVIGDWNEYLVDENEPAINWRGSFSDITYDGRVGVDDLLAVIWHWTSECAGTTPFPPDAIEQSQMGGLWHIPWYGDPTVECLTTGE